MRSGMTANQPRNIQVTKFWGLNGLEASPRKSVAVPNSRLDQEEIAKRSAIARFPLLMMKIWAAMRMKLLSPLCDRCLYQPSNFNQLLKLIKLPLLRKSMDRLQVVEEDQLVHLIIFSRIFKLQQLLLKILWIK